MERSTIGKYTFTKSFNIKNYRISDVIEKGLTKARAIVEKEFKDDVLSFLPEVQVEKGDSTIQITLEILLRVAPFTPKVQREEAIVKRAANLFFEMIKEKEEMKKSI